MAVTPDTNLKLLKCNLNLDEMNQINFRNATAQYNFFNSLQQVSNSSATYQRKDNVIRYPAHIDSIIEYNYVMYQNHNYTNKWFYAYIVRMEYVNDNMTNIYIKTDPYQTWQFDIEFKRSFVEREHVNDDTQGLHTVPENLETGEYVYDYYSIPQPYYLRSAHVVMATTAHPDSGNDLYGTNYGGVFSGYKLFNFLDVEDVTDCIANLGSKGKLDAIQYLFLAPDELTGWTNDPNHWDTGHVGDTQATFSYKECTAPAPPFLDSVGNIIVVGTNGLFFGSTSDKYVPKNNKLYTYPYNFFCLTNNIGTTGEFHYEDFANPDRCVFSIYGTLSIGCSIKAIPINYKNIGLVSGQSVPASNLPQIEGVSCAKYPVCSWDGDVFTNWLTQNAVNIGLQATGSALQLGLGFAGLASGGGALAGVGMVGSGILGISNAVAQVYEHNFMPPQMNGSVNAGDINYTMGYNGFSVYRKHIKREYCEIIDNFWSMYGYKINTTKVPNITGRRNWNYVKTIDVNIEGYIPQEDLNEIKGMFNNGVTIWHNPATFLDYSQNNDII